MFDLLYRYVSLVLMPLRWAARSARCSVCSSGRQEVGLRSVKMGAAYVYFDLVSVL